MSVKEMVQLIGKECVVLGQKVPARATIVDVRPVFGRVDIQVRAEATGSLVWVDLNSVRINS